MTSKRDPSEMDESAAAPQPEVKKPKLDIHSVRDKKHAIDAEQEIEKLDYTMSFPEQLMHIVDNDSESKGTIVWKDDGCTFWISTKDFIEKVLRVRFTGTKFESFVRKLNRWGFKRVHEQSLPFGTVAYRHELFQRGRPELLKNMSGVKKRERVPSELFVLREQPPASDKRLAGQLAGLLQPQFSISPLTSPNLEQALLQKQMLQLLGHSATPPFQSFQPNDAETLLNQILQQRIAWLSAAQVASLQLAATPISSVSAGTALLRLQQLNNGSV